MKIAYSGIEGAFAYIAAKRIFPKGELVAFGDFHSAYKAVEDVGQVTDLMFQGDLFETEFILLMLSRIFLE